MVLSKHSLQCLLVQLAPLGTVLQLGLESPLLFQESLLFLPVTILKGHELLLQLATVELPLSAFSAISLLLLCGAGIAFFLELSHLLLELLQQF